MLDIIFSFPKSAIYFFRFSRKWINKATRRHLLCIVLAVILLRGRRSLSNIVRLYFDSRHKSSLSRCLNRSVMPTFLMVSHLQERLLQEALGIPNSKRIVYLIIDSTYERKQAKKMENRIVYKKGHTSDHSFVMGLLYFPDTHVRIPLPRRLYQTKGYCQKRGRKYRSQVELARQIIKYANLPSQLEVIVIFDSFFPSESVIKEIRRKGYHYVCSVRNNRVDKASGQQLKAIAKHHIEKGALKNRLSLRVPSKRSRYNHESAIRYETKTYVTYTEKYNLSKMGEVTVIFSQKVNEKSPSLRYIVTDIESLTTKEILSIYSTRWQIELFFKELKSYLGFGHYQLLRFPAIMRYVDIVVMSFMYLEHLRIKKLMEAPLKKEWIYARTLQMSYVVQQEVRMTNLRWLFRKIESKKEMELLEQELQERLPIVA